ncbi:unnamed protein product [Arctia plantaginis]|uniref:Hexosyltransferase n=1 Tax=Arctia plantaginis TaxID=874455 RepID=A0A8S0Z0W3_ARCPL|nr:unnamed protein product [Arctia plantaginis]
MESKETVSCVEFDKALGMGMGGVRRSHAAAFAALGALLLLLLARLPPPVPVPAPAPALVLVPEPAPLANRTQSAPQPPSSSLGTTSSRVSSERTLAAAEAKSSGTAAVRAVSEAAAVPPAPAAPPAPPSNRTAPARDPHLVYVSDVYVSGHERPHPELCPSLGARLRLLILVTSAPSHAAARDAVRLTWGHYAARADVAIAFVLGAPPASLRDALRAEDELYGDLIVGRFVDSYSNLTLKTLSMLEWADTYCPRAPRLLKTDDDMFINVGRLLEFAAAPGRANATRTVWGKVVRRSLPKRTTKSKYYVSPQQFPGKVFPDFATGPAYLLTADCVRPLLAAAPGALFLRLEDVFVTGVLAAQLHIRRAHAPEFYNKKVAAHPCAVQRGLAIHMVRYHEQFDLWRKLLDGKTKCAS